MRVLHQQVGEGLQTAGFAAIALAVCLNLPACEGAPARSKPWRNADTESIPAPGPAVAERVAAEKAVRDARLGRRTLRVAVPTLPATRLGAGDLGPLVGPVFEPLLPRLASASVSADGLLWTLDLRDGIAAHDDKPLTSSDVRRSLEIARSRAGGFGTELRDVVAIELLGTRRLRLRLRRANGYIRRVLEEVPIARLNGRVGTGPYSVETSDEGSLLLQPFAGHTPPGEPPAPIELVAEPDEARALARVQIGDLDLADDHRGSGAALEGGTELILEPARFRYLAFNARRTLFADPEVRRAASMVIDRQLIAVDGHRGLARGRQLPLWPDGPVNAPAAPVRRADRRAAAELLDRAGWTQRRVDGTRERDKQKLIAVAVTGVDGDPGVELAFDQLRSSGFVLDVRRLPPADLSKALARGNYDLAVLEWSGFRDWDLSPLLESKGATNLGHVESSVLDEALRAMRQAASPEEREQQAARLAIAIEEVMPIVTLVQPTSRIMIGNRVSVSGDGTPTRLDLLAFERAASGPGPID